MFENLSILERAGLIAVILGLLCMAIHPVVGIAVFLGGLLVMAKPWRRREKRSGSNGGEYVGDGPDVMDGGGDSD